MSFYSADALPRAITDLEGVLAAGGVLTLFGRGTAARLAIVLGAPPPLVEVPEDLEGPDDGGGREGPDGEGPDDGARDDWGPDDEVLVAPLPDDGFGPAALQGPGDHPDRAGGDRWDEGVDEIPDDEFPVRDEGADLDPGGPPPLPTPSTGTADRSPPGDGPSGAVRPGAPTPGVVTPDPVVEWRAHALCCAMRGRGVPADVERLPDGRPVVRSAYRADLVPLAAAWRQPDGSLAVPPDLQLDGPRLRLWVLAAGARRGRAYTLGLDPHARETHEPLLTACQRAGLGATLAGEEDEPVVAIVGQRRQRRLAELVGSRPRTLVDGVWPE